MAKPDRDLLDRIVRTLTTPEDVDYFFDNLTSPDWIEPLAEARLFAAPPPPVRVDGGVQFPSWSASRYLVRMAERSPEQVRQVLQGIQTDNVRVLHDYADAVLAMPPTMAVEFIPVMTTWLESPFQLLLPTKLAHLLRRLARANLPDAAISLAKALFQVRPGTPLRVSGESDDSFDFPTEAEPIIDSYQYERLIEEVLPDFIAGTGIRGLEVLSDLLTEAMAFEVTDPDAGKRDYSWIWRRAVEPHAQNSVPSVRSSLVAAVRSASLQLASDRSSLPTVIQTLEGREWSILRRVALDVLRLAARKRSALVSSRLTSSELMYDVALYHEYWNLLHERFADLTPKQRTQVLRAIETHPALSVDDEGNAVKAWQAAILAAIGDKLPSTEQEWFEQLVHEGRLRDHPEFQSYSESFVGPTSPLTDGEFAAMSEDELLTYLQTWEPGDGWARPSAEGLGHQLDRVVRENSGRYSKRAERFSGLPPVYLNSILHAFRNAATNAQAFDWRRVLRLAESTLIRGGTIGDEQGDPGQEDLAWAWTRSTIAHLLDVGFNDGPAEIPFELRDLAWSLLKPLTDDPDPSVESEARYGGNNMDPTTVAINTVRGQAIESVIKYAVWVHRHAQADSSAASSRQATGFDRMPEVREVLNRHLDRSVETSYAVHSMYGRWFPWLGLVDEAWTKGHVPDIFPADDGSFLYWEAAWDAYIGFCQPYDASLALLKDEYQRAVSRLGSTSPDRKHPFHTLQNLATHLMVYYLRTRLALNDRLLESFFTEAIADLRAGALRFVGRNFYRLDDRTPKALSPPPSGEIIERAVTLWEARLEASQAAADTSDFSPEIAQFGWWFVAPVFETQWLLRQLISALRVAGHVESGYLVIKRLAELVSAYPQPVLTALELMMKGEFDDWLVLEEDSVTQLLATALAAPDQAVRKHAEQLTHALGARGYRQFRVLLKSDS